MAGRSLLYCRAGWGPSRGGKGGRWFSKKAANAQQHLNHSTEWFLVPAREYEVQRRVQRREKKRKITEKNDLGDNIIYRDDVTE